MTAAIAAFRAGNAPHILQVFEVGTATMMASKGAIVPVTKSWPTAASEVRPEDLRSRSGGLLHGAERPNAEFPVQQLDRRSSTYNKDALKAAGIDPDQPPKTWPEVALAAAKLKASGHKCPFTTSWGSWTQLESFSAWHNTLFATKEQWLRRTGHAPRLQHAAARAPHREPGKHVQAGAVRLQGPRQRGRRDLRLGRMRDGHGARRRSTATSSATPSSPPASRRCRFTPTCKARRRTRSSAARACG